MSARMFRTMQRLTSLRAIVEAALRQHRIAVEWLDADGAPRANVAARMVAIPRDLDVEAHALAALHEIGHVLHPCPGSTVHRDAVRLVYEAADGTDVAFTRCIACEEAAWDYARRAVGQHLPWTPRLDAVRRAALATYRDYEPPVGEWYGR